MIRPKLHLEPILRAIPARRRHHRPITHQHMQPRAMFQELRNRASDTRETAQVHAEQAHARAVQDVGEDLPAFGEVADGEEDGGAGLGEGAGGFGAQAGGAAGYEDCFVGEGVGEGLGCYYVGCCWEVGHFVVVLRVDGCM